MVNWLGLIVDFLMLMVTTVLTVKIICQTNKLSKKQIEQDLMLNEKQEELQKRQIRIDTFDYKSDIYHALYRVFKISAMIQYNIYDKIGTNTLTEKTCEQLFELFNVCMEVDKIVFSEVLWLFKLAEYVYPDNIYQSIKAISNDFDELSGNIGKFNLYAKILTENELAEEKKKLINDIHTRAKNINGHVAFIESIIPYELSISNLEK